MIHRTMVALLAVVLCGVGPNQLVLGRDSDRAAKTPDERIADLEQQVAALQRQLRDLQTRPRPEPVKTVYPLRHAVAVEVADSLYHVAAVREPDVVVVPEPITNKILVRAPANKSEQILKILAALDELSK